MPRKNRLHLKNSFYHIMVRGNFRQPLFLTQDDYLYFYELLQKSIAKFDCRIHLFCLMTNHVHIVIEIKTIPLSKIMQSLESIFSRHCNKNNSRQGHLFQGRFREKTIWDKRYFIELIYYIHQNPRQAHMVESINDYRWSSHQAYNGKEYLAWLTTHFVEDLIATDTSFKNYEEFILNYKSDITEIDVEFNQQQALTMEGSFHAYFNPELVFDLSGYSIKNIIAIISEELDIPITKISSTSLKQEICKARSLITYFAHYHAKHTLRVISYYLERDADSLSRTLNRHLSTGKIQILIQRLNHVFKHARYSLRKLTGFNPDKLFF